MKITLTDLIGLFDITKEEIKKLFSTNSLNFEYVYNNKYEKFVITEKTKKNLTTISALNSNTTVLNATTPILVLTVNAGTANLNATQIYFNLDEHLLKILGENKSEEIVKYITRTELMLESIKDALNIKTKKEVKTKVNNSSKAINEPKLVKALEFYKGKLVTDYRIKKILNESYG
jgi:translation elongation factor EF-G